MLVAVRRRPPVDHDFAPLPEVVLVQGSNCNLGLVLRTVTVIHLAEKTISASGRWQATQWCKTRVDEVKFSQQLESILIALARATDVCADHGSLMLPENEVGRCA